ncbi:MAG: TetR/AcrR family transcriptional regulator [Candidatus Nanopelagicales bacterium]|nr:TetR/AcrR family transcriptional regulator [Candidatus Nanopelagicales bacterium]
MDEVPFFSQTLKSQDPEFGGVPVSLQSSRRTQIMVSGLEVFAEKGFHLASMDDIAKRAGVSKPILYQHFSSKEVFYLGVLDERVDVIVQQISDAIDNAVGNRNRLEAAIACYFKLVDDADQGFRLIFESDFTMNHEVRARVEDVVAQVSRVVGAEVAKQTGKSLGEANILAGGLCGMAQAAAWRWLRLGRPIAIEDAISKTFDLAWNGLSSVNTKASSPEADVVHLENRIS